MPPIETYAIANDVENVVDTHVASEEALIGPPEFYDRWNEIIFDQLIRWAQNPSQLADEHIELPSARAIDLAIKLAKSMRDNDMLLPLRVVPTGDGGIAFERWHESVFESIEIDEDGSIELMVFEDSKLKLRQSI